MFIVEKTLDLGNLPSLVLYVPNGLLLITYKIKQSARILD